MKAPKMVDIKNYISESVSVITPTNISPKGLFVPKVVSAYGKISGFLKVIPFLFHHIIKTLLNIRKSYGSLKKNLSLNQTHISTDALRDFEVYAKKLGCSQIGYTKVPRDYIFSNKVILFENAIVFTMDMNKRKMKNAPSIATSREVWRAYAGLGLIVNKLTDYLRNKGFRAQASPALGGETNYPYLAQKAGMGYIGKHGLLISKNNGPSQRIAAIYTNIKNLPYTDSEEHKWIPEFCESCNRCVKTCPSQAIYKNTLMKDNGHFQHIDYKKCAIPFSKYAGCSICIKECTFFKGDYNRIKRIYLEKSNL